MTIGREDSRGLRLASVSQQFVSQFDPVGSRRPSGSTNADFRRSKHHEEGSELDSDEDLWSFDDLLTRPGKEAPIRPLPNAVLRQPSDRAAHLQVIEQSYRMAHAIVATKSQWPLLHGRCCLAGLLVLELLRVTAWHESIVPGHSVFGIHWLTTTSDLVSLLSALPFFCQGTRGNCVVFGCVGPMVTLVFSMCFADMGALFAYVAIARPVPLSEDASSRSLYDVLQAQVGAWEFLLFASVALQVALCACCWRIYRELRLTGLYPPGGRPMADAAAVEVSYLEIVCEAEDAMRCNKSLENCEADNRCYPAQILEDKALEELSSKLPAELLPTGL